MNLKIGMALLGMGTLCACTAMAPLTQEQHTANQFAAGAHAVDTAEIAFLRQVQSTECISDFYNAAFAFATAAKNPRTHAYPSVPLDLLPDCQPKELTAAQLQTRQKLMDALAAYGDAMQALMAGGNDQALDSDSESMAKGLQRLAKQGGITSTDANDVAGLNAAVVSITQLIIDHREYSHVKEAASNAEPCLEVIVNTLKSENTADAIGIQAKLDGLKNAFHVAVLTSREQKGAASLIDIAEVHATLESFAAGSDPKQLNAALDALVSSNKALASGDKARAADEVSNLISASQKAVAIYNASK